MSNGSNSFTTVAHVCEDTDKLFDIADLLIQAGYTPTAEVSVADILATDPSTGELISVPTTLLRLVDDDTIEVTASNIANYFGNFTVFTISVDLGNGDFIFLEIQVIIDPVNDAPTGADKTVDLVDGSAYIISESDFGYQDPVEGNAFQSVLVSSLPAAGTLLLNGSAVAAGTDISIADIQAGHLSFVPPANSSGIVQFGFQVRDNGGTTGCNASDLDLSANYLTFKVPFGSIGDYVFHDANNNGVQDGGETGVAGVTVTLKGAGGDGVFGTADDTTATTTTDANGKYQFNQLAAGKYEVDFSGVPADKAFTTANQGGNDNLDSDVDASGKSHIVTLAAGQTDLSIDAGLVTKVGSLGDTVFFDANNNGLQDSGEVGVAGVNVTLTGAGTDGVLGTADDTTASTTTDADGKYVFNNLTAGQYQVQFSGQPGYSEFTAANVGGDDSIDSDVNAAGLSSVITLAAGENNTTVDAGLVLKKATLGDTVFYDVNSNGVQDAGDVGLAGVTVTVTGAGSDNLFGTADDTTASTTTDANGQYLFTGLNAGQYQVQFSGQPVISEYTLQNVGGDDTIDSDADGNGLTQVVTLTPGQIDTTVDGGLVLKKASLGDYAFYDNNRDGVQNAGDTAAAGITVTLKGAGADGVFGNADDVTATTTTDANGKYAFTGLTAYQSYQVQFSNLPAGYEFTAANFGGDDTTDSDADGAGLTEAVFLAPGDNNTTLDVGMVLKRAHLGDQVFFDNNGNGIQDAGDTGAGGITVTLKGAGADGVFGNADDITATTTTDAGGKYYFLGLEGNQSYKVQFSALPAGYEFTTQDAGGNDATDSDVGITGESQVVFLAAGETNLTLDAGLVAKKSSLGDRVWLDANNNGVQDGGEAGVAGVTVTLKGAGTDGVFGTADDITRTTTTDSNGIYGFGNLSAGQYQVAFSGVQAGLAFTTQDAGGNDTTDSDVDATGKTASFSLGVGESNTTIDAGLVYQKACLGDQVFFDNNGNGIQDAGDTGAAGITVTLKGAGADGIFGSADDTTATTTTDAGGKYGFHGLTPNQSYKVQFSALPAGYEFTTQDAGGNDATDSDVGITGESQVVFLAAGETNLTLDAGLVCKKSSLGDRVWHDINGNGVQDSGENGLAGVTVTLKGAGTDGTFGTADDITRTTTTDSSGIYGFGNLTAGQYQVTFSGLQANQAFTTKDAGGNDATDSDVDATGKTTTITLAAGESNTTVDAGVVTIVSQPTACVGDRVWYDENKNGLQDSCEDGVAGVTVKLIGAGADGIFGNADDISKTTTTDSCGYYKFTGLTGGQQYQVQFGTLTGYGFTTKDVGSNDAIDSDANTSTGLTNAFTLAAGQNKTDVDAGLICRPTASVGDRVWYDTCANGVQDWLEMGAACVTVKLIGAGADGIFGNADDISKTTTTDWLGNYKFSGLTGGQLYQIQFSRPDGYTWTTANVGSNDSTDSDASTTNGLTSVFTLADGENRTNIDAGLVCRPTASVGDRVWIDCDGDGIQDSGEAGVACVSVKLIGAGADGIFGNADDVCKTTTTDSCGYYKFTGLTGGEQYQIQFGSVTGYNFTAKDVGSNNAIDSDADSTGKTAVFTLADGENNCTIDAGLVCKPTASVGDRVWIDANNNGLQDSTEAGVACVTVKLIGAGADGIFGNADDISKTTTTDSCGNYKFTGLTGDQQYQIQFGSVSGYNFTTKDVGANDAIDSDADSTGKTAAFTLAAGQNKTDVDAGLAKQVTACIVGSSTLYEGEANCYQVKLSAAVSTDTWVKVSTIDGTAKRTSTDMSDQEIMAGGKFDVRNYWGQVTQVYYDQIPNNLSSISYGTHATTGPTAMTADYALYGADCKIDADGSILVKVAAGQTSSSSFSLEAWQERVFVDKDIFPNGGYKEAAWETLSLHLSDSSNSQVTITCSDLNVNIGDTTCYTLFSPIALDLDGNGIQTTALIDSKGTFDLLGTGNAVHSGWLSSGDAFLAIDNNANGKVDDISELFGGNKGDGFAKLATFDSNGDGVVNAQDADFAKLLVWQDLDGNHQTDAGELRTLAQAGIASLDVGFTDAAINQLGNVLGEHGAATRADGSSISMVDVYFNVDADGASVPALDTILSSTNALLDKAFGSAVAQAPAAEAANDVTVTADAETLRHLAALLEQHAVAA